MNIIVSWDDNNKNIGRLDFHGQWTLQDLMSAGQQVQAMHHEAGHQIGLIINLSNGPMLPDKIIEHTTRVADMRSNNLDGISYFAVVGSNTLGKALFRSFCKIYRSNKLANKVAFVDSMDEARAILAEHTHSHI